MSVGEVQTATETPAVERPHDARAVANYFLDVASSQGVPLDHLKLQKLVYIAHGWHLAVTGKPLFYQTAFAWPYGPAIPAVYRQFREYGDESIDGRATYWADEDDGEPTPYRGNSSHDTRAILERVWALYGTKSALQLSALTHAPGRPWDRMGGRPPREEDLDVPIPNEIIRQYYTNLSWSRRESHGHA